MQIDHYLIEYAKFHEEFFPKSERFDKLHKLISECLELLKEYHYAETVEGQIDEAVDVMNTSIAFLVSVGVADPLHAGWQKLQVTAAKYRAERAANE